MDSGHRDPEPGAGNEGPEKEAVSFLRRGLKEAQVKVELWKEQAEEARKETIQIQIQLKSNAKVHQAEMESIQKELAQIREENEKQGKLVKKLRARIEKKDELLRNCRKALSQLAVDIEENLTDTEHEDQEDEGIKYESKSSSHESTTGTVRQPGEGGETEGQELGKEGAHVEFERSQVIDGSDNQALALEAKSKFDTQTEELKSVRNELVAVKQQLNEALDLGERRGKELVGAQVFLRKADTLTVADIVQKVNALNEEIFQMAAYLGEVLVHEVLEPEADRLEHRQAAVKLTYDRATAQHSVIEPKEESNPLLVQIIMQIALTNWCGGFGTMWTSYQKVEETAEGQSKESSGKPSILKQAEQNMFVSELYNSIRDHEDQAVAGRWRSLTKAHIPFSTSGWDHHLMVTICSIMGVAGWATRSNDEMGQIEKRLGSIFKPLLELRKATGEDVTSADLEISIIQSGQTFDPSYMEDAYTDGRVSSKSAPEQVINTSGLGLQRVVVKRLKGGALQKQLEILSMPKVVLVKTIKEALGPPPPANRREQPLSDARSEFSIRVT